jgi:ankyrin repeat protein
LETLRQGSKATTAAINQLYSDILGRISRTDPMAYAMATKAFSWLMCMREPLSSETFLAAVSASNSDEPLELTMPELLRICSNLIVLDSKLDTLRFAHSSFKEFLEEMGFSVSSTNSVAAMCCLDSCINDLPGDVNTELRPDNDFSLYSALYWATHCRDASVDEHQSNYLASRLKEFVFYEDDGASLAFLAWLDTVQVASGLLAYDHPLKKELGAVISSTMTPLFAACVYGLESLLQVLARMHGFEVDMKNALGYTGLYIAAAFGHRETARLLLRLGADATVQCGKRGNPLYAAAFDGNVALVRLLLSAGKDAVSLKMLQSAFQISCHTGHEDVAGLLLENGLWISCQDDYNVAVEAASQAGFSAVAQVLEKSFSQFSDHASSSSRLTDAAVRKGQLTFLSHYTAKHSIPDHTVTTAALYGQTKIVLWSLEKGLDIEKEGPFGTPLRTASLMGHESTVRALLERDADVNKCGIFGDALQAATMKGHLSVTRLLLQNQADVNNVGGYYGNALHAAAYRGHRDVAEALLDAGALIANPGRYKDAFHAAAEGSQERIISLFLDKGFRFPPVISLQDMAFARRRPIPSKNRRRDAPTTSVSDRRASTAVLPTTIQVPLALPYCDFEEVFQRARRGVPTRTLEENAVSQVQWNPPIGGMPLNGNDSLEVAASKNNEKVVRLVLENRSQLNVQRHHIGQALWAASKGGRSRVVECITSVTDDLRPYIQGSLKRAAWHGHIGIVDQLLEYERNRGPADEDQSDDEFDSNSSGRHSDVCLAT